MVLFSLKLDDSKRAFETVVFFYRPKVKVKVKSLSRPPTLCDPMDCSLSGSSVHGIFQARVLEWVTISFCQSRKCFKNSRVTGRKPNALIARQNESTSERENCMELLESNATQRKHICGRIIKQNQQ